MMSTRSYDVVLAVRSARLSVGHLSAVGLDAIARVVGVDVYYRTDTDTVLFNVRVDARTATATLIERLHTEAEAAGAMVLEPARLEDRDRDRFYKEHLPSYPLQVKNFPTVADAVRKVAGDLGLRVGSTPPVGPPRIEVRYRSGERWLLARPRSLTREGIYVYAGTVPRLGETVQLRLRCGDANLLAPAVVVHATPEEVASTVGGTGFAARFMIATQAERHALESLVVAGRGDGLGALRPAPPRRDARYALRWPVAVGGVEGSVPALDVSLHGLFVATSAPPSNDVEVALSPDDGGAALRARARVARTVDDRSAELRGVPAGCGLELSAFARGDAERFHTFVRRVGQRASRRVLVGAAETRQRALTGPLAAAGYVVAAANDAEQVIAASPGMDLVFLDPSLGAGRDLRNALHHRRVQAFALEPNQSGRTVRSLADSALLG
jgi:hypothetical protein